jgi:hypothetical protein
VPADAGLVDFRAIVSRLHELDYEGKFAIKYEAAVPTVMPAGSAGEPPVDVSANVLRMRDLFVASEKAQGIVRAP